MNNSIFISGYFCDNDQDQLNECCTELGKYGISLQVRNLTGTIMHSATDFVDVELIALSYELIKSLYFSGCYDFLKFMLFKLWNTITKGNSDKVPFTIDIKGIPTINGTENVKCKISGPLSKDERKIALEKSFELATQIENHQFELLRRGTYYNLFGAHIFTYDKQSSSYGEMDVDKEIQNKISKKD